MTRRSRVRIPPPLLPKGPHPEGPSCVEAGPVGPRLAELRNPLTGAQAQGQQRDQEHHGTDQIRERIPG